MNSSQRMFYSHFRLCIVVVAAVFGLAPAAARWFRLAHWSCIGPTLGMPGNSVKRVK
jgi:hypothetical protein